MPMSKSSLTRAAELAGIPYLCMICRELEFTVVEIANLTSYCSLKFFASLKVIHSDFQLGQPS